jgi:hypothetical protein
MSLEKKFERESSVFQFVSVALFIVLYGVSGVVGSCFNGTFNVAKRHLQCWDAWRLGMLIC